MRIVFLDRATFDPTVDITRLDTPHERVEFDKTQEDQIVERLAGAQKSLSPARFPCVQKRLISYPI